MDVAAVLSFAAVLGLAAGLGVDWTSGFAGVEVLGGHVSVFVFAHLFSLAETVTLPDLAWFFFLFFHLTWWCGRCLGFLLDMGFATGVFFVELDFCWTWLTARSLA